MKLNELIKKLDTINTFNNAGELEVMLQLEFEGAYIGQAITDVYFDEDNIVIESEES